MGRPKESVDEALSARALRDLLTLPQGRVAVRLHAISRAAEHPLKVVAEILGITPKTLWLWIRKYRAGGMEAIIDQPKAARRRKLSQAQEQTVLGWVDGSVDRQGRQVHWTLERVSQAIRDEFGVRLGISTIWTWFKKERRSLGVPRPVHYKADPRLQEALKKTPGGRGTQS